MSNDCNGEKQNGKITCITIYIYTHLKNECSFCYQKMMSQASNQQNS